MRFLKIVITSPDYRSCEADEIAMLIDGGIDYVHLRKPEWTSGQMCRLIESIPVDMRCRLRVHSHFHLVERYALAGAHLNHRWPECDTLCGTLTRSCHEIEQLTDNKRFEYQTLSPVFNSISKNGYQSRFSPERIGSKITGKNVIALGGVTPEHFHLLADTGFIGAAMLGYVWNATSINELKETIKRITSCCNI